MSREVPYYDDEECDECGRMGAFDLMGDLMCHNCCQKFIGALMSEDYSEEPDLLDLEDEDDTDDE